MNADLLLKHYEQISDAPDAVERLRRFVFDLAVRGKLVEQDNSDKPEHTLPSSDDQLSTNELPANWRSYKVGTVLNFAYGKGLPKKERSDEGPVPVYGSNGIVAYTQTPLVEKPSIVVGRKGSAGALNLCNGPSWTTDVAYYIVPPTYFSLKYLRIALSTLGLDGLGKGVKPGLSRSDAYELVLAVPPLAEQKRIVAKVDELMGLCDQLEEARKSREATREKLTTASLARLTDPECTEEEFGDNARFTLDALPSITKREDQIKAIRQSILDLAVRGKLVEQDKKDEPASLLVKRIAREKAALVTDGRLAKSKALPPIENATKPFDLKSGWTWVRLGGLVQFVTSGSRDWAKYYSDKGAIFVRMGNLSKDHYRLRLDSIQRVNPPLDGEGKRTRLDAGDILISITGDVGMLGLIPEDFGEAYINQHTAMIRPMAEMKGRYLAELFRSPFAKNQFNAPQRGVKNSFRLTDVTQFLVPLPPLAEQMRIVAKVDELMGICDQLEASLSATETTRAQLLDATLREALEPDQDALEAAE